MGTFSYFVLRLSAIALGVGCTVWSAWQSWVHTPWDFTGPLAAVAAALMFIYCEHALRDRQRLHVLSLGVLGVLAAILSGSVVLQRNAHAQADRVQTAQSS